MSHDRGESNPTTNYINSLFAPEDEKLQSIRLALRQDNKEGINVGPYEGKILNLLVTLSRAKSIVEIGTLYGYSALWMARALPADGKLYCLEVDKENAAKAKALLAKTEVTSKIEVILGDATETLAGLASKGPFDMCFIDANKSGYMDYLEWADQNVRSGGLIVGDNTFLFGNLIKDKSNSNSRVSENQIKVMKNFNESLADPKKYTSVILPTVEGMTVAIKN